MYKVYMGKMLLPVAPEKISKKVTGQNTAKTLTDKGEVNILNQRGLCTISFDALLPAKKYFFADYESNVFLSPQAFLSYFYSLMDLKEPFYFKVLRSFSNGESFFNESLLVSLEDFTVFDDAQNGTDINVSISLKEYKAFKTEVISVSENGSVFTQKERLTVDKTIPKTYTVKKGDNLWTICRKELGDGEKYKEIAEKNGIKNPRLIYPGQVISLE